MLDFAIRPQLPRPLLSLFMALTLLAVPILNAQAEPVAAPAAINDAAALQGVDQAKGVFLIDFTDPEKTAFYLKVIKGTYDGLVRQGVEPDLILVYIGPTVSFLTTEPNENLAFEYEATLEQIARNVEALSEVGVRQEVCAVATEVFGVDNETVLPGMDVVGDGFISLIGYQTQGYHLVPIF